MHAGATEAGVTLTGGFAGHIGPLHRLPDGLVFRLDMQPHHLNWGGRLHGGMVLALHTTAMHQVAADLAGAGRRAVLMALHVDFMDSVPGRHEVSVQVQTTQARRSLAFVACRVIVAGRVVSRAEASYAFEDAGSGAPGAAAAVPAVESGGAGWHDFVAREPGSRHLGALLDRAPPAPAGSWPPQTHLGVQVHAGRLNQDGSDVHDGLLLFVADIAGGRTAARARGQPCVTVCMQARRLGVAGPGAFVEHAPRLRRHQGDLLVVEGDFLHQGQPLMAVSTLWKAVPLP